MLNFSNLYITSLHLIKYCLTISVIFFIVLPAYAEKRIFIIPFESKSNDEKVKLLSTGLTDILTNTLSITDELIIPESEQFEFARKELNIEKLKAENPEIFKKLGSLINADEFIKGELSKNENKFQINIHFINGKTGKKLRSGAIIDKDFFELAKKLVYEIISQEKLAFSDIQKQNIEKILNPTKDFKSYNFYLKGKIATNSLSLEGYKEAIKYFEQAIAHDKKFSQALAEKAQTQALLALYLKLDGYFAEALIKDAEKNALEALKQNINLIKANKALSILYNLNNQPEKGQSEAKKVLELNPNDSFANFLLWLNKEKSWENLDTDNLLFKTALKLNPYLFPAHILKGYINSKKNLDEAIANYKIPLKLNPGFTLIYNQLGNLYYENKRKEEALIQFNNALKISPDSFSAHKGLGSIYLETEDYQNAEQHFTEALKYRNDSYCHYSLAVIYNLQGKDPEAIKEYQEAAKLSPEDPKYHSGLGLAYYHQNKFDEAVEEYKKSLALIPQLAFTRVNLGLAYYRQKKAEEGITEIKEVIRVKPGFSYAHYNLGIIYEDQSKMAEAINEYQEAIKANPEYALAHNNLGIIYQKQGKTEEALNEFTEAIKSNSGLINAYFNIGKVHQYSKKYQEAIAAYKLAIKLSPGYKMAISELANVYLALGEENIKNKKPEEAIANYKEGIKIKPNDERVYISLGKVYLLLGKKREAENAFKKACDFGNKKACK